MEQHGRYPQERGNASRDQRTAPPSIESLWTPKDVASYLRVSVRMLERMRSTGAMPPPDVFLGRLPRYRPNTIRAWLASMNGGSR